MGIGSNSNQILKVETGPGQMYARVHSFIGDKAEQAQIEAGVSGDSYDV